MSSVVIALIFGLGGGAFAYAKLGNRVGYGNEKNVWTLVLVTFVLTFLIVLILLKTLVSL